MNTHILPTLSPKPFVPRSGERFRAITANCPVFRPGETFVRLSSTDEARNRSLSKVVETIVGASCDDGRLITFVLDGCTFLPASPAKVRVEALIPEIGQAFSHSEFPGAVLLRRSQMPFLAPTWISREAERRAQQRHENEDHKWVFTVDLGSGASNKIPRSGMTTETVTLLELRHGAFDGHSLNFTPVTK